ncbi:class I SAM-dependent methyltransferase [Winogradskyella pulchriflava]|uniref:Class I SAM-dependent methyltransferase n=1 Tax=Winogradskyella pulchriflava TaxID=1110688 RepID=A0ABV6QA54_9FLAO
MNKDIINKVDKYYTDKIREYGTTSKGVDWNGKASHFLRFDQLSKVLKEKENFSIMDYGCGFGSYIEYLIDNNYKDFEYFGFDISDDMIKEAKQKYNMPNIEFLNSIDSIEAVDYIIASGIFNVKLDTDTKEWEAYIEKTLMSINNKAKKGFSFNILTSYSDEEYMRPHLFYADPMFYFKLCKERFSRNVALLHDYDLYEFTIIVRKV